MRYRWGQGSGYDEGTQNRVGRKVRMGGGRQREWDKVEKQGPCCSIAFTTN